VGVPVPPEFQRGPTQHKADVGEAPPPDAPVLRTTYNLWLTTFFSPAVLNDPTQESTQWGRNADPDKDGVRNQMEYFVGTSPIAASAPAMPQLTFTAVAGETYALVSFPRRKALSDPNRIIEIETSDNLRTFASASAEFVSATTPVELANPIEVATYRILAPITNRNSLFVRVRVTALLADSDADGLADAIENGSHVFNGAANPGTNWNNADTDGDGIKDGDETLGTLANLNLPQMGCNPLRRNILLEYDWFDDSLDCAAHSHRPSQGAMDRFAAAFANSPGVNPDGTTGIVVIQDRGDGGIFSGGNLVSNQNTAANIAGGVNGTTFLDYKSANFAANRHGYFHYCLMPHRYNSTSGSSGQAEINGDDLIVSLYCAGSDNNVSNTIMHELGHNLSLRHGGNNNCNYKPNYNSVMNYRYQFPGVNTTCTIPGSGVLDYSRGVRLTLNENALDETQGVCGAPPIDFNNSGTIQSNIAFDLNASDSNQAAGCGGTLTILADNDDWAQVFFGGIADADAPSSRLIEIVDCDNPAPF
jgi:hypothetical protein